MIYEYNSVGCIDLFLADMSGSIGLSYACCFIANK